MKDNEYEKGYRFLIRGDKAVFDFIYPRQGNRPTKIEVGLEDVRAADTIEIEFDFDRNGYVIRMDETKDGDGMMETLQEKIEVAFIPSWNIREE